MQLIVNNKGRSVKLTKSERRKLKDANAILTELRAFAGIESIDEALERIAEDGTVGPPAESAEE